jgi:hypothetical protein
MKEDHSRFTRAAPGGAGGGAYVCNMCDHRTRNTDKEAAGCNLCKICYEDCLNENSYSDGNITKAEYDKESARINALRAKRDGRKA